MQVIERYPATANAIAPADDELERRVRALVRVKDLSGNLKPLHERHFRETLDAVRFGAVCGSASARRAALSALDMLSLELCDD